MPNALTRCVETFPDWHAALQFVSSTACQAYAWMDSDDEGAGSGSEGAAKLVSGLWEPSGRTLEGHAGQLPALSGTLSGTASAVSPGEVETLPQMIRLAEAFGKRKVQELAELPAELGAVCAAAARVKYYDPGLFTETLGPAMRKCLQAGLSSLGSEAESRRFSLMEALDVLRALSQLNAAKALSAVFTAAIKAIEAYAKKAGGNGGLDKGQIKFLRELFVAAGREEDVAFLSELRAAAGGHQGSVKEGLNSQGLPMRPGARICDSFAKSGTCRLAANCRFDHPEGMKVTFNSEGFPMRPWAATCPYYMSMGTCDFKRNCKCR
ncbi:unnamed protein product [Symbiodinium sp. CCMP2592]|nr:unnamed protein product [Symbiodinium sp. CCMP2592]